MNLRHFSVLIALALSTLYSCGGGSGDSNPAGEKLNSGYFVDSPVSDLTYEVEKNGKVLLEGKTDEKGQFKYYENSKVKFYLDSNKTIKLGEIDALALVTPFSFVKSIYDGIAVSALIQALDEDNNATNGIEINENKLKEILFNETSNETVVTVIQNGSLNSELKKKAKPYLENAAKHFSKWNLFGEYSTSIDPMNISFYNSTSKGIFAKLLFDGSKGGGVIVEKNDDTVQVRFIELYPEKATYEYNKETKKVNVSLKGKDLTNGQEVTLNAVFTPSENQTVDFSIMEDNKNLFQFNASRKGYPLPNYCSELNLTGNYTYDNTTSLELLKCHSESNEINLPTCEYNQPESDSSENVDFFTYSNILPEKLKECTVAFSTNSTTPIVGLVTSNNSFAYFFKDSLNNDIGKGISPNYFDCNVTNDTVTCLNIYVNSYQTKPVEEFVVEKVIFRKQQ